MKKLITAVVALTLIITTPVYANSNSYTLKPANASLPTLAIIDTVIDDQIPEIRSRMIWEACILDWPSCPSKTNYLEGIGSAYASPLVLLPLDRQGGTHGTQMASVAVRTNSNMNILFIRVLGLTSGGTPQLQTPDTLPNALKWIVSNKEKYNIQGVSISMGINSLLPSGNSKWDASVYCRKNASFDAQADALAKLDVPLFVAVGNSSPDQYSRVSWPACSAAPNVIGIGGLTLSQDAPDNYNNYDPNRLDFYDRGTMVVSMPGGKEANKVGSSIATASFAAKWMAIKSAKPTLTYSQIFDLVKSTGTPVKNNRTSLSTFNNLAGIKIDLAKALNG